MQGTRSNKEATKNDQGPKAQLAVLHDLMLLDHLWLEVHIQAYILAYKQAEVHPFIH